MPGFLLAGTLAFGCTVYDSELVTTGGLIGSGADSSGGTSAAAGTGNDAAGKTSATSGGTTARAGESGSGGTDVTPSDGGAGGEGGDSASSVGGAAATGGNAGSSAGGSAGAGGKAGAGGTGGSAGASGSGGSAGGASVVKCADHPLPAKATWIASASSSSIGNGTEADGLYNPPAHMLDGSYTERWSSGHAQAGDEWIQIDLGAVSTITELTLNPGNDAGDYPRMYAVRVSNKSEDFAAVVKASGAGMPGSTFVQFKTPAVGRYITVRQTNADAGNPWWTIAEVLVGCTD
ncbi:MAG TPA: discoidin domain-containing protein [Polyangiaceae bacterium]|nr:discoidin domain-containing protein [Polyangiaceae bacterium]